MLREAVVSSNVATIGYDDASQTVEVEFKSGGIYRYSPVSAEAYAEMRAAESIGRAVNALRKDTSISCERVEESAV